MKLILCSALVGVVVGASGSAILARLAPKRAEEENLQALQGTWKATASRGFGKEVPAEDLRSVRLTFHGKEVSAVYNNKRAEGTFRLNLKNAGPSEIDVVVTEGPAAVKGKTLHGIYLLEGDTLKVAYRASGKSRPADFTDTDRPGVYTFWFQREKP